MQGWVPIPGTAKARLVNLALAEFAARGYEDVNVVDLATRAGVTTGSLYHHFGNKAGLYGVIRTEIERRLLDRMEGAAEATSGNARAAAALRVAFDAALGLDAARLLSEPHPDRVTDPLEEFVVSLLPRVPELARIAYGAWRAALATVADGADADRARIALLRLLDAIAA